MPLIRAIVVTFLNPLAAAAVVVACHPLIRASMAAAPTFQLHPCGVCGRSFNPTALVGHRRTRCIVTLADPTRGCLSQVAGEGEEARRV